MGELQRLDKLIAGQGSLSRSEVKKLIARGLVAVNGLPAKNGEQKVDPEQDVLLVNGKELRFRKHLYLMLNKPKGVVSAARDNRFPTVVDLVPEQLKRSGLFPAGRLDKDTEGFVLLTDDGVLAHRILSPKSHVPKSYVALLDQPIDPLLRQRFEAGMFLDAERQCLPASVEELPDYPSQPAVLVVIREGMYHQIKRMFSACGRKVLSLKRVQIGELKLDENLISGACRELTFQELEMLQKGGS